MYTSKITSKGQVTLPIKIREHLKVGKGDRVEFLIGVGGMVTVLPVTSDARMLKGMIPKPKKPVSVEDMKRAIEIEGGEQS